MDQWQMLTYKIEGVISFGRCLSVPTIWYHKDCRDSDISDCLSTTLYYQAEDSLIVDCCKPLKQLSQYESTFMNESSTVYKGAVVAVIVW
jgi:hypothetical protein